MTGRDWSHSQVIWNLPAYCLLLCIKKKKFFQFQFSLSKMLCVGQSNMQIRRSTFYVPGMLPHAGRHLAAPLLFPARVSFHSADSFHFSFLFASYLSLHAGLRLCTVAAQFRDWTLFSPHRMLSFCSTKMSLGRLSYDSLNDIFYIGCQCPYQREVLSVLCIG